MLTSLTFARRTLVLLVGAAALGLGALLIAPAAGSEPIGTGGSVACALSTSGGLYMFPHGTRMTVKMEDGQTFTFVCVNGEWVKEMSGLTGSTPSAGTFHARTRTFVHATSGTFTR